MALKLYFYFFSLFIYFVLSFVSISVLIDFTSFIFPLSSRSVLLIIVIIVIVICNVNNFPQGINEVISDSNSNEGFNVCKYLV